MKRTYILIDSLNMFFRCANSVGPGVGIDGQIGMAFHIIMNCVKKSWREYNGTHIVWCMEGKSWRKSVYPEYKLNRVVARLAKTEREQEDGKLMLAAFDDFCKYITEKTNITSLRCPIAEADDLIAKWIHDHPDDNHVIISSDSDFNQLLAPNVIIYNGPQKYILTDSGYYDEKGKLIVDKKTKKPKEVVPPDYYLFFKCIRGDSTDNIFSAYPGVRENGTKNKVGIREAFEDRSDKGFKWNNFMLQRWTDHNGEEKVVKDTYAMNRLLIDLTAQPDYVKEALDKTISEALDKEPVTNVGIHFMKFCAKWDLKRLTDSAQDFGNMFNAKYQRKE